MQAWLVWVAFVIGFAACGGSSTVCPGHVDPSRGAPLVIKTSDGSPTIASVKLGTSSLSGQPGCLNFTVEQPDARASGGSAQVAVYMGGSVFIESAIPAGTEPAPCIVTVVSIDGQSVTVTATMDYQHNVAQHCQGNDNCCDKSGLESLGTRSFYPAVQTVTFTATRDASVGASDGPNVDVPDDSAMPDAGSQVDGGSPGQVTLQNVYPYANCMPAISADPIIVLWTVAITGARGNAATLTKATITVSQGTASIVQDFTAEDPVIALVDGAGSADQRKSPTSLSPNGACSAMCSGATYQLDFVYTINGQSIAVSSSGAFLCVY